MRLRLPSVFEFAVALAAALPAQPATELRVLISGGFAPAYKEVLPEFERTTGIRVTTASGASQGAGPNTIGAMLRRGDAADMVIMSRRGLNELAAEGRVAAGTERDLGSGLIGVSIRAGSAKPDISTLESFKRTLLQAKSVAVAGSVAGNFNEALTKLGLTGQVPIKSPGRGAEALAMVSRGEADFSIQPVSEILNVPGVELLGTLPAEIHSKQLFTAAILTRSQRHQACQKLIEFLSTKAAKDAMRKHGIEPVN